MSPRLLRFLESQQERWVELLGELVEIESHASQPGGVRRVFSRFVEELADLDLTVGEARPKPILAELAWVEDLMSPGVPYQELGSTYTIRRPGAGEQHLLLLGDLDTAFPAGTLSDLPFRVEGGRAFGPGVADMKGGLVVMAAALVAIEALGLDSPSLSIVFSGDEQAGSLSSRAVIEREASGASWCLCVECAREGGKLLASRSHVGVGLLTAEGREAHAGSAHERGISALDALARLIPRVNELTDAERGVFVSVTLAEGGRRRSVIPGSARAVLDVRAPDPVAWEATSGRLRELVEQIGAAHPARLTLRLYDHRPAVVRSDFLVSVAQQAGQALGMEVEAGTSAAAGSSAFAAAAGIPTLDGMGPSGGGLMTRDEHIDISSLVPRAALLALTIQRLANPRDSELGEPTGDNTLGAGRGDL